MLVKLDFWTVRDSFLYYLKKSLSQFSTLALLPTDLKLSCDSRFRCAFIVCVCVFKVITMVGSSQCNYIENTNVCSKRMLKTTVATLLKALECLKHCNIFLSNCWNVSANTIMSFFHLSFINKIGFKIVSVSKRLKYTKMKKLLNQWKIKFVQSCQNIFIDVWNSIFTFLYFLCKEV